MDLNIATVRAADSSLTSSVRPRRRAWRGTAIPLLPIAALMGTFFIWPVVDIAARSMNKRGLATYSLSHLTASNYLDLFRDSLLRDITRITVEISILATAVTLALAFPAAYLMSRLRQRLSTGLFLLLMLPFFVSILVRLFAFTVLLAPNGPLSSLLGYVGLRPLPNALQYDVHGHGHGRLPVAFHDTHFVFRDGRH